MVAMKKSLKIGKGEKAIKVEFAYDEATNLSELDNVVASNVASGVLSDKVTALKIFNYGLDLKVRAAVKAANTESGTLTKQRHRTTAWVMTPGGGEDFKADLCMTLGTGTPKEVNDFLDDLYETESEAIDAWKPDAK
jgi:hypothetical protein